MMKVHSFLLSILLMMGFALGVNAQRRFFVEGGVAFPSASISAGGYSISADFNTTFYAGIGGQSHISSQAACEYGVQYTQLAAKRGSSTSYLRVPVAVTYQVSPTFPLSIGGGAYLAAAIDDTTEIDFGLLAKLKFHFTKNLFAGATYHYGLRKFDIVGAGGIRINSFQLGLGYMF